MSHKKEGKDQIKGGKMEQLTMDLGKGESCEGMQYSQKQLSYKHEENWDLDIDATAHDSDFLP